MSKVITRFAPSPSGYLHLGHAYSAILAYNFAKEHAGTFILRIEDIDSIRCDEKYIDAIYEDLSWLGLSWETPVRKQSDHLDTYQNTIRDLTDRELIYPCFCSRKEIREEAKRAGQAPHGPEGILYPGTCKNISISERQHKINQDEDYALRLDLEKALSEIDQITLFWNEHDEKITAKPELLGDIVIARKDISTSYHLSVVIDDYLQEVTDIIRGEDLYHATHIHRVLQETLGAPQIKYHHHKLLTDKKGNRYAKRDKSKTIKSLRSSGSKPDDIYNLIGLRIYS